MTMQPRFILIVAASDNDAIGRASWMPFRQRADLKRFKALTMGHHLVMGRKTYEAIGKPLPGRTTLVLTRSSTWHANGVTTIHSLEEAREIAQVAGDQEVYLCGGGEVYALGLALCSTIHLTRVHCTVDDADTYFRFTNLPGWKRVASDGPHPRDDANEFPYTYDTFERVE